MRVPLTRSRSIVIVCTVLVATACGGTAGSGAPSSPIDGSASAAPPPALLWPARPIRSSARSRPVSSPRRRSSWSTTLTPTSTCSSTASTSRFRRESGSTSRTLRSATFENPVGYGGIEMCNQPCISPLHTHDETGVAPYRVNGSRSPIPLASSSSSGASSSARRASTEHCDPTPIAVYIDGEPYEGDPRAIELTDGKSS